MVGQDQLVSSGRNSGQLQTMERFKNVETLSNQMRKLFVKMPMLLLLITTIGYQNLIVGLLEITVKFNINTMLAKDIVAVVWK